MKCIFINTKNIFKIFSIVPKYTKWQQLNQGKVKKSTRNDAGDNLLLEENFIYYVFMFYTLIFCRIYQQVKALNVNIKTTVQLEESMSDSFTGIVMGRALTNKSNETTPQRLGKK